MSCDGRTHEIPTQNLFNSSSPSIPISATPAHPISAIHPLNPKTQRVRPPLKPQPQPRAKAVLDPHNPTPLHLDMHQNVVLLDNGSGLIKVGLGGECDPSTVIPNCGTPLTATT
ncbi:hypothetical protein GBA52_022214 [Prunus armeniaca]|nr:hypothetical protein GBA52_022214 [Prunus armeniaca]